MTQGNVDPASDRQWAVGEAYEPYVGRWSRLVAERFVHWLDPAPDGDWLDIGCGTGALSGTILETAGPASVRGVDRSPDYAAFVRRRISDPRAEFLVADAQRLPSEDATFDHVVSGLVLNFVPDPARALREMERVVRSGGWVAAYVWDYSEGMELMRHFWDAAIELDPEAASLDEGVRFPLCNPEPLRELWEQAGLEEVSVVAIDIDTEFHDFDEYWSPFLGAQGPAPSYNMSLDESARDELKTLVRGRLPMTEDGRIPLRARAWGVRGRCQRSS